MIRTLILPLGLAAGLAACAPQVRVSNGTPEPIIKRELAWSGGNTLDVGLPAQVTYVQGPVASVSIEGAKVLVDMVEVHNGVVGLGAAGGSWNEDFDWDGHGFRHTIHIKGNHHHLGSGSALKIRIVSPDVRRFKVGGAARLDIQNYDAPTLQVDADGAGRARRGIVEPFFPFLSSLVRRRQVERPRGDRRVCVDPEGRQVPDGEEGREGVCVPVSVCLLFVSKQKTDRQTEERNFFFDAEMKEGGERLDLS